MHRCWISIDPPPQGWVHCVCEIGEDHWDTDMEENI